MVVDEHLTWNFQISQTKITLSRNSGLLPKLKYYVIPGLFILQFLIQFSDTEFKFVDKIGTKQ